MANFRTKLWAPNDLRTLGPKTEGRGGGCPLRNGTINPPGVMLHCKEDPIYNTVCSQARGRKGVLREDPPAPHAVGFLPTLP